MLARLYLWLVCHNACPCGVLGRLPIVGPWVSYYCGNVLERRYISDDDYTVRL